MSSCLAAHRHPWSPAKVSMHGLPRSLPAGCDDLGAGDTRCRAACNRPGQNVAARSFLVLSRNDSLPVSGGSIKHPDHCERVKRPDDAKPSTQLSPAALNTRSCCVILVASICHLAIARGGRSCRRCRPASHQWSLQRVVVGQLPTIVRCIV